MDRPRLASGRRDEEGVDALRRLQESEERFRTLFRGMEESFYLLELIRGADGHVADVCYLEENTAAERLVGVSVKGRKLSEVNPGFEPHWLETLERVANSREAERFERYSELTGRWLDFHVFPATTAHDQVGVLARDVSDRHAAQDALRVSEERQAFLLKLSDALRPLDDPLEVQSVAARVLGEYFAVAHATYATIERDDGVDYYVGRRGYSAPGQQSFLGRYPLSDFPVATQKLRSGRPLVVDDVVVDPDISAADGAGNATVGAGAFMIAPLVKSGRLAAILALHDPSPRAWEAEDSAILVDAAERTWAAVERAHAQALLRRNFENFASLIENAPFGVYVVDSDFRIVLASRQAHKAFEPAVGSLIGTDLGEAQRAIWPEPFAAVTIGYHRRALDTGVPYISHDTVEQRGDKELVEAYDWRVERIVMPDGTFGVVCYFYDQTDRQQLEDALRKSEDRLKVLVAELQHRVRNILSVVRAVFSRTVETSESVENMAEHFSGRLDALARAQVVLTQDTRRTADLENLVRDELLSVGAADGPNVSIDGPEIDLPDETAEALGLAVHELTTNSIKYGALRAEGGALAIRWWPNLDHSEVPRLVFSWVEQGVPAVPVDPGREGFGTELLTRALPYRVGAETSFELRPGGVRCLITLPLPAAARRRGVK